MKKLLRLAAILAVLLLPFSAVTADAANRVDPITSAATVSEGYYVLVPKCNLKGSLTIKNYSAAKYAPAVSYAYKKAKAQIFYLRPSVGGTYMMISLKSNMAVGIKGNSTAEGAEVRQAPQGGLYGQRWYFLKNGSYYIIQSAMSKKCLTVKGSSSANNAPIYMHTYSRAMSGENWRLVRVSVEDPEVDRINPNRKYKNTINGRRTLKSYLQNAMVPCGRTLYIWGGGWGGIGTDTAIIGYQTSWQKFFNKYATDSYDYTRYRYDYGKGLDCSGFAAWVLYNTLYKTEGNKNLVQQSTGVASYYAGKGWAELSKNGASQTFRPGDVVSMDGHVWISLGEFSDDSVLLVHSSPKGVQISGTAGIAAKNAAYYMKKYFPEWPYAARTVSKSYLNYVGKARWKVTGAGTALKDPDGIQKMAAAQVMRVLFEQ